MNRVIITMTKRIMNFCNLKGVTNILMNRVRNPTINIKPVLRHRLDTEVPFAGPFTRP